jgi:hypothetical protein
MVFLGLETHGGAHVLMIALLAFSHAQVAACAEKVPPAAVVDEIISSICDM